MTQELFDYRFPHHGLFPTGRSAYHSVSWGMNLIVRSMADTFKSLQARRKRRKNLHFALTLDSATLRDIGIDKTELRALIDAPFTISRRCSPHAGPLAVEHNLKFQYDDEAVVRLALMQKWVP